MTSLESIIAAFLRDLTFAQDAANRLSARLSVLYRHDPILRFFPVPNALLDDVEVTFRFAFDSPELGNDPEQQTEFQDPMPPSRLLAADAAALAAARMVAEISARVEGQSKETVDWMASEKRALVRQLVPQFHEVVLRHYLKQDVPKLESEITAAVREAVLTVFSNEHEVVGRTLDAIDYREVGSLAAAIIRNALNGRAPAGKAAVSTPRTRIRLAAADLANAPEFTVQTIRLHARLRNYRWVIVEGDVSEDQLLPEN